MDATLEVIGKVEVVAAPSAPPLRAAWLPPTLGSIALHGLFLFVALESHAAVGPVRATPPTSQLFEFELKPEPVPAPAEPPKVEAPRVFKTRSTPRVQEPPPMAAAPAPTEPLTPEPVAPAPAAPAATLAVNDNAQAAMAVSVGAGGATSSGVAKQGVPAAISGKAVAGVGNGGLAAVDRSRLARLSGGAQWQCPFPIEADDAGIDNATVTIKVDVNARGEVGNAAVLQDPGYGFGAEARRCAKRVRWEAGLNPTGTPIPTTTIVRIRFTR